MSNQILCNILSFKTFRIFYMLVHIAIEDNIIFSENASEPYNIK